MENTPTRLIFSSFHSLQTSQPWMAGENVWASPDWKMEQKAVRQPPPSFLCLGAPALAEGLIRNVHFTNGCVSHGDQFFLLCGCRISSWLHAKEPARDAFVQVLSVMNSGAVEDEINTPDKVTHWLGAVLLLPAQQGNFICRTALSCRSNTKSRNKIHLILTHFFNFL